MRRRSLWHKGADTWEGSQFALKNSCPGRVRPVSPLLPQAAGALILQGKNVVTFAGPSGLIH